MLDNIGYTQNIYGKKVLENSCGEGNILIEIVKRFIADGRQQNRLPDEIACELASDIIGYEIDAVKLEICKQRLNELLIIEQIPPVDWNIKNKDFLKSQEMVDFIIGNPPYITYHDLTKEEREFVVRLYRAARSAPSLRHCSKPASSGVSLRISPSSLSNCAPALLVRSCQSRIHWPSPQP